jgi:hypothetical protein
MLTLAVWKLSACYDSPAESAGAMMAGFVAGTDRGQAALLPECLDDWVDDSNPVRVIDAFVEIWTCALLALPASIRPTPAARLTIPRSI